MSDFTLRIVSTLKEALDDPHSIIWMKGLEWDDLEEIPAEFRNRTVIFTSAWQAGVYRNAGMGSGCPTHFIVPEGCDEERFRLPAYEGRIDIVWRGSDVGSAIMLVTVANALKLTPENAHIKIFGPATPLLMQNIKKGRDEVINDFTEAQFSDALSDAHAFVYPAFRHHSEHIYTVRAAKAGCVCVVPNTSGFKEILGPFGAYVHHSRNNVDYAQSLAEKVHNTIAALRDSHESVEEAINAMSSFASLNFSTHYEQNWITSVKNQLSLIEAARVAESSPVRH